MSEKEQTKHAIGILAFGSLIDDPGVELKPLIEEAIDCVTPFKVEYTRLSATRDHAPTLIPFQEVGRSVNAKILILKKDVVLREVKSIL